MFELNRFPQSLGHVDVAPLDKAGKDPAQCANRILVALWSPTMKLLELIIARRFLPLLEERSPKSRYEYFRAGT